MPGSTPGYIIGAVSFSKKDLTRPDRDFNIDI